VVLMDCEMPGVDGYEATRQLRAAGCALPIVAVSAHVLPAYEARARAAGMDAFIAKPVRRAQFTATLLATCGAPIVPPTIASSPQARRTSP
jgi:CheY-like chemotaxis protein